MNACVAMRAMNGCLVDASLGFVGELGFPSMPMYNRTALGYLMELTRLKYDWVVSLDEDSFVWDCGALKVLMEHMEKEGYACCGPTEWLRGMNPAVVNPFFMVLNVGALRELFRTDEVVACTKFEEGMKRGLPEHLLIDEASYVNEENYYPFFFWMLKNGVKTLYLDGYKIPEVDSRATVVKDHCGKDFMVHCWWAREYRSNPMRFKNLIDYAKRRKEVTHDSDG
jgi:hypothetical protein